MEAGMKMEIAGLGTTEITLPLKKSVPGKQGVLDGVPASGIVLLTGTIYTARDAAHRRIADMLAAGKEPPFPLDGAAIYYCGPAPAKPGETIGSCGPTSSSRMDALTLPLLERGLKIMVGKGDRSAEVMAATKKCGALYLKAIGGAAVYYKQFVKSCKLIAFPELGCEAVYELYLEKFPIINL